MNKYLAVILIVAAILCKGEFAAAEPETLTVLDLDGTPKGSLPDGWQQFLPKKQMAYTTYEVGSDSVGTFLNMRSGGTGSWIEKPLGDVEISQFSTMEWSWKITMLPDVEWEQEKDDDDFAVRIELVFDFRGSRFNILNIVRKGLFRSLFRGYPPELVIGYVWAGRVPAGKPYVSPMNKRMIVIPIESGNSMSGIWIEEKRDIKKDLGEHSPYKNIVLKKIRIRSDSDNSLSNAAGSLKNIVFKGD